MTKLIYFFLILSALMTSVHIQAQGVIDKGYIKMEVIDIKAEDSNLAAMAGMFKNSSTEIYFLPQKSLTKASMMGGMTSTTILVDEMSQNNLYLLNMMGQKIRLDLTEEELNKMQQGETDASDISFKYYKDETKEILGYKCHKAEMISRTDQQVAMTLWVTDKIKSNAQVTQGLQSNLLKGFPLGFDVSIQGQLKMTWQATQFEKDFDKTIFNVNTKGYKTMTMEEFMNSVGGMMGGF